MATYSQTFRGGGLYGEGHVVVMTGDGGVATWEGFGIGKITGPGFSSSWAVCGYFQTETPGLARLNGVAVVSEYDSEENGNWTWVIREWKNKVDSN